MFYDMINSSYTINISNYHINYSINPSSKIGKKPSSPYTILGISKALFYNSVLHSFYEYYF